MRAPAVAIRVDSGACIGSGHLMRCLTLAAELRRRGARVRFVSREHSGHLIGRIEERGFDVRRLPVLDAELVAHDYATWLGDPARDASETLRVVADEKFDWLVADHYGIDETWERCMRAAASKLLAIDDLANRIHDVDVIVDQNYAGATAAARYQGRVPAACRQLLGPRYALLQSVYAELRHLVPPRDGRPRRVLVFFGAYDPSDATNTVLDALRRPEFSHLAVDVIAGGDAQAVARVYAAASACPPISVHEGLPGLAGLMVRADLAIGACGSTTWERACLGLPSLVATLADNQRAGAQALAQDEMLVLVGRAADLDADDWATHLGSMLADPSRLAQLGQRMRGLTDGRGAGRVAGAMLGFAGSDVFVRPARSADEELLLDWANDPDVRRHAFSKQRIDADMHHRWFATRLNDPNSMLLIGEDACGLPLGQVRFDADPPLRTATVHVSVDAALRGTGVGPALLRAAIAHWRTRVPEYTAIAEVLHGNERSQRLFLRVGFNPTTARRAGANAFELQP